MFSIRTDAEAARVLDHLNANEDDVQRQWSVDTGMTQEDWKNGIFGGTITARAEGEYEFNGDRQARVRQTLASCTNLMVLYMDYVGAN
jgi:hypothetical protein